MVSNVAVVMFRQKSLHKVWSQQHSRSKQESVGNFGFTGTHKRTILLSMFYMSVSRQWFNILVLRHHCAISTVILTHALSTAPKCQRYLSWSCCDEKHLQYHLGYETQREWVCVGSDLLKPSFLSMRVCGGDSSHWDRCSAHCASLSATALVCM